MSKTSPKYLVNDFALTNIESKLQLEFKSAPRNSISSAISSAFLVFVPFVINSETREAVPDLFSPISESCIDPDLKRSIVLTIGIFLSSNTRIFIPLASVFSYTSGNFISAKPSQNGIFVLSSFFILVSFISLPEYNSTRPGSQHSGIFLHNL